MSVPGQRFGQAEIADLDPAIGLHKAVGRLDIAVNDPELMGLLQPLDHVQDKGDGPGRGQRPFAGHQVLERRAGHQLHDDVRLAGLLIRGQHKDTARMSEGAGQPAFLAKTLDRLRGRGESRSNELHRHPPTRGAILRFKDRSHPAAAQLPEQSIAAHGFGKRWLSAWQPPGVGGRRNRHGPQRIFRPAGLLCVRGRERLGFARLDGNRQRLAAIPAKGRTVSRVFQNAPAAETVQLHTSPGIGTEALRPPSAPLSPVLGGEGSG